MTKSDRNELPPPAYYSVLADNHPGGKFDPWNPDAAGALREAYAWISAPTTCSPGSMIYDSARYNALTAMIRRALEHEPPCPPTRCA